MTQARKPAEQNRFRRFFGDWEMETSFISFFVKRFHFSAVSSEAAFFVYKERLPKMERRFMTKTTSKARYSCYPFMREKSCLVDYEIRTDSLTTRIGEALASLRIEKQCEEIAILERLQPLAYHLNGSVRGRMAITEQDLAWLDDIYDRYITRRDDWKNFYLPQGTQGAALLHVCRSEAKKSYRALHKVSQERPVDELLFSFLGLLANVFFVLAVAVNQNQGIEEIVFHSKSYGKG